MHIGLHSPGVFLVKRSQGSALGGLALFGQPVQEGETSAGPKGDLHTAKRMKKWAGIRRTSFCATTMAP